MKVKKLTSTLVVRAIELLRRNIALIPEIKAPLSYSVPNRNCYSVFLIN